MQPKGGNESKACAEATCGAYEGHHVGRVLTLSKATSTAWRRTIYLITLDVPNEKDKSLLTEWDSTKSLVPICFH